MARAFVSRGKGRARHERRRARRFAGRSNCTQHPIFKRQDTNIYSTVPISFVQAALGDTLRIKTVDGEVEYQLKAGTQTDTRIRLKGKGVPFLRNRNTRGDHYVTLVVQVPEKLNESQKEALRAFDDAMKGKSVREKEKKAESFEEKIDETISGLFRKKKKEKKDE